MKAKLISPNDFRSFIQEEDIGGLPVKYQFIGGFIRTEENLKAMKQPKVVEVKEYASKEVHTYPFHKHISKII
jgi:hypothetical protein